MPPKVGLLGSLSAIALGTSLAVTGVASADDVDEEQFERVCDWIDEQNDPIQLATIIQRLSNNDEECIFDPETGKNYCDVCLELAGEKLVSLIVPSGPPPGGGPPVVISSQ